MRTRLSILYFLQFSVWGCYLTSFGQLLGAGGLGKYIAWFYAAIGLVSILTPTLLGHIADKFIRPTRLLGLCHVIAAAFMLGAWIYASSHNQLDMTVFYPLYLLFLTFYMPTMALANTTAFGLLKNRGILPVDAFPAIRIWGTVGFVTAMWMVNSLYWHDGCWGFTLSDSNPFAHYRFQYNSMQLMASGILGLLTAAYSQTLPMLLPITETRLLSKSKGWMNISFLKQFFSIPKVRIFLIFATLTGVCLQISNGFATPFITHFSGLTEYIGTFASSNATMLFSISQMAEAFCILFVGISMKRWGINTVFAIGIIAWALRFLFLGLGDPGSGLWMLIASMVIYGLGFNFITIAGHLYMEQISSDGNKGLGQGVMMLMSNGIGATVGTLAAGGVINHWCKWEMIEIAPDSMTRLFMGEWQYPWIIFACYAAIVFLAWITINYNRKRLDIR